MPIPEVAKEALIRWYRRSARPLPWRDTRDPYRILVSEIMLQQTHADRVTPKYHEFLERFPTLEVLAAASPSEVIRAWVGLGYNRRALNLQRTCRAVVERHARVVPRNIAELLELPGVGPYTAGAIACFAFEQDVGFVDVNIRRVLHRIVAGSDIPQPLLSDRQIAEIAAGEVPRGEGYVWNQALMELGATLCRARSTACLICPVREWCAAAPTIQSALVLTPRRASQPVLPFEQTSRFTRGRIIDALLRAGDDGISESTLFEAIGARSVGMSRERFNAALSGLTSDGLVEVVEQSLSGLAEEPEGYDGDVVRSRLRYRLPT